MILGDGKFILYNNTIFDFAVVLFVVGAFWGLVHEPGEEEEDTGQRFEDASKDEDIGAHLLVVVEETSPLLVAGVLP